MATSSYLRLKAMEASDEVPTPRFTHNGMPNPIVYLVFTIGDGPLRKIFFELRQDIAPRACENFRALCTGERAKGDGSEGPRLHYAGTHVSRIVPGLVIQGGNVMHGYGSGTMSIFGPTFEDENFVLRHMGRGVLSYLNNGPNSNHSEFFIDLGPCKEMDKRNIVFGYVISGLKHLDALEASGDPKSGKPLKPVVIVDSGQAFAKR